jgi:hypothetical protein
VQLLLSSHDTGPIGRSAVPRSIDDASDGGAASTCELAVPPPQAIPVAAAMRTREDQAKDNLCVCMV